MLSSSIGIFRLSRSTQTCANSSRCSIDFGCSYNTLSIDSGGGSGNEDAPAIADTLGDVDLTLDQIENREALRPLLAALPERERTVLVLRFFESMTQTQIAERVGISQMHVSRLLAKSLTRLRDQLE